MNSNNNEEKDISTLLGLPELSEEDQATMLEEIGSVILESALLRLVTELSEEEVVKLESIMDERKEPQVVLTELTEAFPRFTELLEEEAAAFRNEAQEVLK